jgi:hypothetical protein
MFCINLFSVNAVESEENEGAAEPEGPIQKMLQDTEGKLGNYVTGIVLQTRRQFCTLNFDFSECYPLFPVGTVESERNEGEAELEKQMLQSSDCSDSEHNYETGQ